jgi:hypothetical protein
MGFAGWPPDRKEQGVGGVGERRKYQSFTVRQELEIVLAGLRGDVTVVPAARDCGDAPPAAVAAGV